MISFCHVFGHNENLDKLNGSLTSGERNKLQSPQIIFLTFLELFLNSLLECEQQSWFSVPIMVLPLQDHQKLFHCPWGFLLLYCCAWTHQLLTQSGSSQAPGFCCSLGYCLPIALPGGRQGLCLLLCLSALNAGCSPVLLQELKKEGKSS